MALLIPQAIPITGVDATLGFVQAVSGDTVEPDPRAWIEVKNTNAASRNLIIVVPGSLYGQPRPDVTIVVPATIGHWRSGPLVADLADPATGLITINYSATTNVTHAVFRI